MIFFSIYEQLTTSLFLPPSVLGTPLYYYVLAGKRAKTPAGNKAYCKCSADAPTVFSTHKVCPSAKCAISKFT